MEMDRLKLCYSLANITQKLKSQLRSVTYPWETFLLVFWSSSCLLNPTRYIKVLKTLPYFSNIQVCHRIITTYLHSSVMKLQATISIMGGLLSQPFNQNRSITNLLWKQYFSRPQIRGQELSILVPALSVSSFVIGRVNISNLIFLVHKWMHLSKGNCKFPLCWITNVTFEEQYEWQEGRIRYVDKDMSSGIRQAWI